MARSGQIGGEESADGERSEGDAGGDAAADGPATQRAEPAAAHQAGRDARPGSCRRERRHAGCRRAGSIGPASWPKTQSGERLEDQVLGAVGEHRDEDEDREAPRCRLRPSISRARRGSCLAAARRRRAPGADGASPTSTPHTARRVRTKAAPATVAVDHDQPDRREWIEKAAGERRGDRRSRRSSSPRRWSRPAARRAGSTRFASRARRVVPEAPTPMPISDEGE